MTQQVSPQIPLALKLPQGKDFENFHPGDNHELIENLQSFAHSPVFIWSQPGNGRSHLLQALCNFATEKNRQAFYLPIKEIVSLGTGILAGLDEMELLCIDDIELIAGDMEWEEALFHLYNRIRENDHHLVVASSVALNSLNLSLNDLKSRLGWGLNYYLQPLSEQHKKEAIQQRAREKGFDMSDDVIGYMQKHLPRDSHKQFALVEKLDQASLSAKRKITIPFLKEVLKNL